MFICSSISVLIGHNGGWREEDFRDCNVSCGGGIQKRNRYCDNPKPDPKLDGRLCSCNQTDSETFCNGTNASIQKTCNEQPCKGIPNSNSTSQMI